MPHPDSSEDALLVFARPPVPGQVKTRLAQAIGAEAACAVYRELLGATLDAAAATPAARYLYLADADALDDPTLPPRSLAAFQVRPQRGGDLGARMAGAFADVFAAGHPRAILVGSDCPSLTPALLTTALGHLRERDTVFGPAQDGGYYLVGQRAPGVDLFSDIPWSTPEVWRVTHHRLQGRGWSVALLPVLEDIDDVEALGRWRAGPSPAGAP